MYMDKIRIIRRMIMLKTKMVLQIYKESLKVDCTVVSVV